MEEVAFVLGNGTSRAPVDIQKLRKNGPVYACNAVYRTDVVDHLIAVDAKMVAEIAQSGYQHKHPTWTNFRKSNRNYNGFRFIEPRLGWSSGPSAMFLASSHQKKHIYILGFDYKGTNNGKNINNIFADTQNYKQSEAKATYYGNWLKQTCQVIKDNPGIQYTRVIQPDNYCPPELNNFENFNTIHVDEFCNILPHECISQNEPF
jgi:hypothetical protein